MIEKQLTIINKLGLHARAAAKLIQTTTQFSSEIQIDKQGRIVDGKSIMAVMMLARITSYNVCYTKLLRFLFAVQTYRTHLDLSFRFLPRDIQYTFL